MPRRLNEDPPLPAWVVRYEPVFTITGFNTLVGSLFYKHWQDVAELTMNSVIISCFYILVLDYVYRRRETSKWWSIHVYCLIRCIKWWLPKDHDAQTLPTSSLAEWHYVSSAIARGLDSMLWFSWLITVLIGIPILARWYRGD